MSSSDSSTEQRLYPGQKFGPYLVEKALGQGAMDTVYKARYPRLNRGVLFWACAIWTAKGLVLTLLVILLAGCGSAKDKRIDDQRPTDSHKGRAERKGNALGMKFVKLPKGTFYMGWDGEKKGTKTEIKEDFEIAIHTVTQGQWKAVMGNTPSYFSRDGEGKEWLKDISDDDLARFPVENVSWDDPQKPEYSVQEFIKRLNKREEGSGWTYRLPTEAEWEYACRGGATSEEECSHHFYFDKPTDEINSDLANFDGNYPFPKDGPKGRGTYLKRTTVVGSYKPNKLGLYDIHGNVWQWCSDWYTKGSDRVLRGGCWRGGGSFCQAALRSGLTPTVRCSYAGFRLARVPVR